LHILKSRDRKLNKGGRKLNSIEIILAICIILSNLGICVALVYLSVQIAHITQSSASISPVIKKKNKDTTTTTNKIIYLDRQHEERLNTDRKLSEEW
jgi:flagellar basal body-associated protein FliL